MNPKKSYWPRREPIVLRHAGVVPAKEIALMIGVSESRLRGLCAKHGISLKVPGLMSRRIRETHPSRREPQSAMKIDINKLWKPVNINMNEYERDFGGQS